MIASTMKFFKLLFVLLLVAMLGGCSLLSKGGNPTDTRFSIAVSILPYQGIVERIVGEDVEVFSIVPEGYVAETYEPTPQEMKRLLAAKVVVLNGDLPYEKKIETYVLENNSEAVLVKLNESLDDSDYLFLDHTHEEDEDDHDGDDEHSEEEVEQRDPHTWLSPRLVIKQLPAVLEALQAVDPDAMEDYLSNAVVLVGDLEALTAEIQTKLQRHWGRSFLVYHPAYGYFAEEVGLQQRYMEVDGKEPSATEVKELLSLVSSERISVVFLEKQFAARTAETLAEELDVPVEYVNPLEENYFELLRTFTDQLVRSFEK